MSQIERLKALEEVGKEILLDLQDLKPSDTIDVRFSLWRRLLSNLDRRAAVLVQLKSPQNPRMVALYQSMCMVTMYRDDYKRKAKLSADGFRLLDFKIDCLNIIIANQLK